MPMRKSGYVYILANKRHGIPYIGVTSDFEARFSEHCSREMSSFTKRYNLDKLVYYETFDDIADAIAREKQLKRWHREWKINLIEGVNPDWRDLSLDWTGEEVLPAGSASAFPRDPETSSG
ncbi:MAG: GIY-YIG nuclease family protein [Pacificimonas sp.]